MSVHFAWPPLFGALAALILLVLYSPVLLRPAITKRAMRTLLVAADGFWEEAKRNGKTADDRVRFLHDAILFLAMVAPRLAGGTETLPEGKSNSSDPESGSIEGFLSENTWVLPYVSTAACVVDLLRFTGRPVKYGSWRRALMAAIVLRYCLQADGGVDFGVMRERAVKAYKTVRTAASAGGCDGLIYSC